MSCAGSESAFRPNAPLEKLVWTKFSYQTIPVFTGANRRCVSRLPTTAAKESLRPQGRTTAVPCPRRSTTSRACASSPKRRCARSCPYTPQHLHRLEKAGRFPRRIQLGPNRVGWRLTDIERWIEERAQAPLPAPADDHIPF